ncbi:hypothetical protein B0H16DRAFT_134618 [Mycena metata]|uniref:Uncharacterized protein n=1 Tax=Mycena metata TaxID=1033252 RepID=A0AAD7I4J3_9AGAR|nr:hypothetical protein B0H16DRAFT_134618 [Mycena metata]
MRLAVAGECAATEEDTVSRRVATKMCGTGAAGTDTIHFPSSPPIKRTRSLFYSRCPRFPFSVCLSRRARSFGCHMHRPLTRTPSAASTNGPHHPASASSSTSPNFAPLRSPSPPLSPIHTNLCLDTCIRSTRTRTRRPSEPSTNKFRVSRTPFMVYPHPHPHPPPRQFRERAWPRIGVKFCVPFSSAVGVGGAVLASANTGTDAVDLRSSPLSSFLPPFHICYSLDKRDKTKSSYPPTVARSRRVPGRAPKGGMRGDAVECGAEC